MKNILSLDLGTTSIGWAFVKEADENSNEVSSIEAVGVRVNPLTTDEQINFEKGRPVSENANRTLMRGMRRNLDRYKLRRSNLIESLLKNNIISRNTVLAEDGKQTTFATFAMRAKAATEQVDKECFARILLMINKKRGYKSSRKANNQDEGQIIDGMTVAKRLYEERLTPGQLSYKLLQEGKKTLPDFYRSDLRDEFDKVWAEQKKYYPEILTDDFKKELENKGLKATSTIFWTNYDFNTASIKAPRNERRLIAYELRSKAIATRLDKEEMAFVIAEINGNIYNSSGYLGAISDRSKELYFNKQTVGQYLYQQLQQDSHTRMKNQVFYRQDYLDEFETIWQTQAKYHKELTPALKEEIREIIIFYQRKLKSQKNLVSFCEFESKKIEMIKDGKTITKTIGARVIPKSSPLFQEFKIWQNLSNLKAKNIATGLEHEFDTEAKQALFEELNIKGNLTDKKILEILGYKPKEWKLNFSSIEGNRTNKTLYEAYLKIIEQAGHDDIKEQLKIAEDKDDINLADINVPAAEITNILKHMFEMLKIDTAILEFDSSVDGKNFEQQAAYQLWHLLYAYEEDKTQSGNEHLYKLLQNKFGFALEQAKILANIPLADDYGSLSAKAIRKVLPYLKDGHPFSKKDKDEKIASATALAGYNHSSSLTKDERAARKTKDRLELIPKNSLRNPVVEKILNQMVNVYNAIADTYSERDHAGNIINHFKFDEIRIELARELKKNADERAEMTKSINTANARHELISKKIISDFDIQMPSRNDIIRYKLYEELKFNAYKDIYTNEKINYHELFSNKYDIDHIIPQQVLFDDSYSNKTLVPRHVNLKKSNKTARDFIMSDFGEQAFEEYKLRVNALHENHKKETPSIKAKHDKLLKKVEEIGEGFIQRDLRDSQYIAKKAKHILEDVCNEVQSTTGKITDRLRRDWGLINVMKELNMDKYRRQGLTETVIKRDGNTKEIITDWTKRNDHRHHAMDALVVAFTQRRHIQYLNHLNARIDSEDKLHKVILSIEENYTHKIKEDDGSTKRIFNAPIENFRQEAKRHLDNLLISIKAKNKVATKNRNRYKTVQGIKTQTTLTPRGQLHKETVYGKIMQSSTLEVKVDGKMDKNTIDQITNKQYRDALTKRLKDNAGNPKKAFAGTNSPGKKPIYIDEGKNTIVPERVKIVVQTLEYTIRKAVSPDNFKTTKNIEKIIDARVRKILLDRLEQYNNNAVEAFSNLDKNPIWMNKEKGICIKNVKISGVKTAEAIHYKKDHLGQHVLSGGGKVPVDFISTGNNHHTAIYIDEKGCLQDNVVSFFEAVERARQGLPIVDKEYNSHLGWRFLFSMKQNEYFVFPGEDFIPTEIDLENPANNALISPNLFRVQKFSKIIYGNSAIREYVFRHHLETSVDEKKELKDIAYKNIKSLPYLENIVKVRINHIGKIVKIGEY